MCSFDGKFIQVRKAIRQYITLYFVFLVFVRCWNNSSSDTGANRRSKQATPEQRQGFMSVLHVVVNLRKQNVIVLRTFQVFKLVTVSACSDYLHEICPRCNV